VCFVTNAVQLRHNRHRNLVRGLVTGRRAYTRIFGVLCTLEMESVLNQKVCVRVFYWMYLHRRVDLLSFVRSL
jgi:hypothetical protein